MGGATAGTVRDTVQEACHLDSLGLFRFRGEKVLVNPAADKRQVALAQRCRTSLFQPDVRFAGTSFAMSAGGSQPSRVEC